jgi:hypothetical protein
MRLQTCLKSVLADVTLNHREGRAEGRIWRRFVQERRIREQETVKHPAVGSPANKRGSKVVYTNGNRHVHHG